MRNVRASSLNDRMRDDADRPSRVRAVAVTAGSISITSTDAPGYDRLDVAGKAVAAAADEQGVRLRPAGEVRLRQIGIRALVAVAERGGIVEDDVAVNQPVEHQRVRRTAGFEGLDNLNAVVVGLHVARRSILAGVPSHADECERQRRPAAGASKPG